MPTKLAGTKYTLSDDFSVDRSMVSVGAGGVSITSVTYNSDGLISAFVENGVLVTITYNADGTVNTETRGSVTRTATYNSDGTISAFTD